MPTPRQRITSTPTQSSRSSPINTPRRRMASQVSSVDRTYHHRTAEEIALEEAEKILRHTPGGRRGTRQISGRDPLANGSARSQRHKHLNDVRESLDHSEHGGDEEREDEEDGAALSDGRSGIELGSEVSEQTRSDKSLEVTRFGVSLRQKDGGDNDNEVETREKGNEVHTEGWGSNPPPARSRSGFEPSPAEAPEWLIVDSGITILAQTKLRINEQDSNGLRTDASENPAGEEGSSSDSTSESDAADNTSASDMASGDSIQSDAEDMDDDDDEEARMERLFQAAKGAAVSKAAEKMKRMEAIVGVEEEIVLQLDQKDEENERHEAPIPGLAIGSLPRPHLSFSVDGVAKAASSIPELPAVAGPSRIRRQQTKEGRRKEAQVPELDDRPYERDLSKREKIALPRQATQSDLWATMPSARVDLLPQMKRDYQALALASSLDPKRFMKGGTKLNKVPETFAIGTITEQPRHLQDTTVARGKKYHPGQLVQDLVRDDDTGSYAKRKFDDLQWSRMKNGRGRYNKNIKW